MKVLTIDLKLVMTSKGFMQVMIFKYSSSYIPQDAHTLLFVITISNETQQKIKYQMIF